MTLAEHKIDAHEVYPKLFVGSYPTASLRWHFDLVVLCANEHQDLDTDIEVLKAPFDDNREAFTEADKKVAIAAARRVVSRLKAGKKVLVTCHAGVNRSALVAALAMIKLNVSATRAIEQIRKRRVGLYGLTPLCNKHFEEWLLLIGKSKAQ